MLAINILTSSHVHIQILLLNRATEVINYWQDEEAKHTMEDARKEFPDCVFTGS